jgi:hypothetical protein
MVRWVLLLSICVLASGCFVFDEIDAGQKIMESHSAAKPAAQPAAAPGQKPPGPPAGEGWWKTAKSLDGPPTDPGDNPAVHCTIGHTIRFMRKKDCLSQGGRVASL